MENLCLFGLLPTQSLQSNKQGCLAQQNELGILQTGHGPQLGLWDMA